MARVIDGINGTFSGKVGPVVGYTRYGQGFMRSLPKKIQKAPSQKQLDNRKAMAAAQAWLKYLTPYVRAGFKNYSKKQHGFGSALSYLKLNALREDFTVDPSRVLITWGDLPVPLSPAVSNTQPGFLEFTWEPIAHSNDHAILLATTSTGHFTGELCGARRDAGKHLLDCKFISGMEADVYIGFITEERERCSNSVYLGRIKVV